ncbi:YndM family protein [Metabacillus fastidiosus]|uniref:YndM family protein n=1 Tax=Metabacillus fastidiosus TaxID=1458 RepID=UPI002E21417D|nr:YndM family protein [Metabacillus fastidiosus]
MTILIIKFITAVIAFAVGLDLFFDATITDILSFSLFVTIVSYIVGDKIILPRLGNRNAVVADFLFTYLSVWIIGSVLFDNYLQIAWGSIISAVIIGAAEVFVHLFLQRTIPNKPETEMHRQREGNFNLAYGTEFSEEQSPFPLDEHKK